MIRATATSFIVKYRDMARTQANQVMRLNSGGSSKKWKRAWAAVIARTNWLALKATLYHAHRRNACPATVPRSTLTMRTLPGARMRAGTQSASVTEKFSVSVRCVMETVNCSVSAAASARSPAASASCPVHIRSLGNLDEDRDRGEEGEAQDEPPGVPWKLLEGAHIESFGR